MQYTQVNHSSPTFVHIGDTELVIILAADILATKSIRMHIADHKIMIMHVSSIMIYDNLSISNDIMYFFTNHHGRQVIAGNFVDILSRAPEA